MSSTDVCHWRIASREQAGENERTEADSPQRHDVNMNTDSMNEIFLDIQLSLALGTPPLSLHG